MAEETAEEESNEEAEEKEGCTTKSIDALLVNLDDLTEIGEAELSAINELLDWYTQGISDEELSAMKEETGGDIRETIKQILANKGLLDSENPDTIINNAVGAVYNYFSDIVNTHNIHVKEDALEKLYSLLDSSAKPKIILVTKLPDKMSSAVIDVLYSSYLAKFSTKELPVAGNSLQDRVGQIITPGYLKERGETNPYMSALKILGTIPSRVLNFKECLNTYS